VCAEAGAYLLHLGSGCIHYGEAPHEGGWQEDDFANPLSFYSRTKYAADLVLSQLPHVGVARLRMPIDDTPNERNLITKLASYDTVIDVANSVTVVDDLVEVVAALVARRATGVFHATNPGLMRHRDLLDLYRDRPASSLSFHPAGRAGHPRPGAEGSIELHSLEREARGSRHSNAAHRRRAARHHGEIRVRRITVSIT
jgi:hypothetical protein